VLGNELVSMFFLEKLVSETDFTDYLDSSGRRKLANTILQFHKSKKGYPDIVYGFPYNSSLCALIKILESDKLITAKDEISLTKFPRKNG